MFRTPVTIPPATAGIDLQSQILTLGSCFSDHIGDRLIGNKFNALSNPFGIIYNPRSIFWLLQYALTRSAPRADGYVERDGVFYHYDFHSRFSNPNKGVLEGQLKQAIDETTAYLHQADVLLLTLGTIFIYKKNADGATVASCHKVEASNFAKYKLSSPEIVQEFKVTYDTIKKANPSIKIILTVSPVRHIKDTLVQNSLSKATLVVACHDIVQQMKDVSYFPSFEIMVDDLRDYRFYEADMLHPSHVAIDYIWEKFGNTYFDDRTISFLREWAIIRNALAHRPFHPAAPAHQQFLLKTIQRLNDLKIKVDVEKEIQFLKAQLV